MKFFSPLLRIALVFSLVWIVSRTAIYLLPGDPAEFLVHESLVQTTPEALRAKMDLHRTGLNRILSWPSTHSLVRKETSTELVKTAFQNSAVLVFLTFLMSSLLTGSALYASFLSKRFRDQAMMMSTFVSSLPIFVVGPILVMVFSIWARWVPPVQNSLLPALTLSLSLSAFWYRALQHRIESFLPESPVNGARARGVDESTVFFKYLLAPILGGFAAYFGTQIGILFNGSLLVEIIFQWPGIGSLLADSVLSRDYPVIELSLLVVTLITLCSQQLGYSLQKLWEPKLS
jgi:ABC-type dipeptide/oligopeptide/nickel transport system permease component